VGVAVENDLFVRTEKSLWVCHTFRLSPHCEGRLALLGWA
jgi:hypothetical protein